MFNKYKLTNSEEKKYTLTKDKLDEILSLLDKDVFRIDLCTVNSTSTGSNHKLSMEIANELLEFVKVRAMKGRYSLHLVIVNFQAVECYPHQLKKWKMLVIKQFNSSTFQ